MDNSTIIPTNFSEKNATCKMQNFCILLAFLLITIALLVALSIYCYLGYQNNITSKYQEKRLLPFNEINNKSKQVSIDNINQE